MNIIERLRKEGIISEDLDELVHEQASRLASKINNDGLEAQVHYLSGEGWEESEILSELGIFEK